MFGMSVGRVLGAGEMFSPCYFSPDIEGRRLGLGPGKDKDKGNGKKIIIDPPSPPNGGCKIPKLDFKQINASNPSSWYYWISQFMSKLMGTDLCLENESSSSYFGNPGYDPNLNRDLKFRIRAALGHFYTLLSYITKKEEAKKEAEKDTHPLALRAA